MSALAVEIDGRPVDAEEAVDLWKRFSAWMDAHPGDLAGFARAEGFASVHPEMSAGRPLLAFSRTAAQKPYSTARKKPDKPTPAPKGRQRRS